MSRILMVLTASATLGGYSAASGAAEIGNVSNGAFAPKAAVSAPLVCPKVADLPSCVQTGRGIVLAPDDAEARRVAAHALAGEARFRKHFGRDPTPYAVVLGTVTEELKINLKSHGASILPWRTASANAANREGALRRMLETRAKEMNLTPAEAQAELDSLRSQLKAKEGVDEDSHVVPHELGHMWLMQAFWPGSQLVGGHYGGPGPDWLDEGAAMAMEDDLKKEERRADFRRGYAGAAKSQFEDLVKFLKGDHPFQGIQPAALAAPSAPPMPPVPQGSAPPVSRFMFAVPQTASGGAPNPLAAGGQYYAHGTVFLDFLLERSGNVRILEEMAGAFAGGKTIEAWLKDRGKHHNLASSLPDLESQWRKWIAARYGASGKAS
jgi:hypothetical protein